uniref:LysR family transcriptional regulator n=1 Tax=Pararhizobium sp. IMCC3301 TaxID=3067904 RepID=UPI0027419B53|nr:LysR family transcriptional regulator [Pararhizobium sp. IMCC3301]
MNIKSFDMNLLRVLDALLHEGSTVRAGARIGLSQPAVSAALGRLRLALRDELFIRRGQGLEPTDYARTLAIPLREALDRIEYLLSGPEAFDPALSTDTFKLSGSDFFAEMLMPKLADQLSKRAPGIRVQLVDLVPDNYVETLEHYEVDIALIPATPFPDWVAHQPVFSSNFSVVARSANPRIARAGLAPGDVVPIDLFCDLGHVLFSPEGKLTALGDQALARVGRTRQVKMTMPVFSGVYRAVSESDLIALIPEQLASYIAPKAGLQIYRPPMPIDPPLIHMIWHKRSTANPAHKWLRELIAETLLPLNEGHSPLPE